MPYRVTPTGDIICDTADEALSLSRAIQGGEQGQPKISPLGKDSGASDSRWTESRFKEFVTYLHGYQLKVVEVLMDTVHGKTDKAIVSVLNLDNTKALGGVFSGLSKNARRVGMDGADVLKWSKVPVGNEMLTEYGLTDSFRSIAQKVGWPGKMK